MKNLLYIKGFLPYLAIAFLNASVDLAHKLIYHNYMKFKLLIKTSSL
ncbi:hypothetical protein ACHJH3_02950 [Campylobacter sp. MOP7]